MKQRISVRAIVRNGAKVLLLRRAAGRQTILGKLEFPGGRVGYGEQPEDALRRVLQDDMGVQMQTSQLYDVVTYIDRDDRDIQYAVITYCVSLAPGAKTIQLSEAYDRYVWSSLDKLHQDAITDLASLVAGILQQDSGADTKKDEALFIDENKTSKTHATVYSDGGSRGNPGPSAAGFVIIDNNEEIVEQGGEYLGITTSSQAEYHGVRLGLERARDLGYETIDFRVDSMLVVNQLNGVYKLKNRELWPIYERIKGLIAGFRVVRFSHVRREYNQLADGLVNKTLDGRGDKKKNAKDHV